MPGAWFAQPVAVTTEKKRLSPQGRPDAGARARDFAYLALAFASIWSAFACVPLGAPGAETLVSGRDGGADTDRDVGSTSPAPSSTDAHVDAGVGTGADADAAGPGRDAASGGNCVSDRVDVPAGQGCTCAWVDCEATELECACDVGCYADDADCLIETDGQGGGSSNNETLGTCVIQCDPESDLSEELNCTATSCEPTPNSVSIEPSSDDPQPTASALDAERDPVVVKVLFVIDNSASMLDDQMAAACAIDEFFDAASANEAVYETGVLTTDIFGDASAGAYGEVCTNPTATYDSNNEYSRPPQLVGLSNACNLEPVCSCASGQSPGVPEACSFDSNGAWLSNGDANSRRLLRQLIVQGQACSGREAGLEQAFQFFAEMERAGTFDASAPHEVVVISDEDTFADATDPSPYGRICSFSMAKRHTETIPDFEPPSPIGQSCIESLTDFYKYYFTSRGIIVNGIHFTNDCRVRTTEQTGHGYLEVIEATGGEVASICHCETFPDFFAKVGARTSDLSTSLCFPEGTDPDPSTIQVTYTEVEPNQSVPKSSSDGWTLDTSRNCLTFSGSWGDKHGDFHVDYVDRNVPLPPKPDPVACLDPSLDVLEDSLAVTCDGSDVPRDATNGWTFDAANKCLTFHGSWTEATCAFEVHYF
ncbi:MAG: hypothetical protein IPK13_26685 [Deltaproteobacteria bacterium]|nr:hypothetical protein [Deltaproteobacteria bacterium]